MMDFFGFPEQYKVDVTISPDEFVIQGNLHGNQDRIITDHLNCLRILYSLQMPDDSEMLVLEVEIDHLIARKGFIKDLARVIASSLPYKCILLMTYGDKSKLYMFRQRNNVQDANRSVIEEVYSTKPFRTDFFVPEYDQLFEYMRQIFSTADNNVILENNWSIVLMDATMGLATEYAKQGM